MKNKLSVVLAVYNEEENLTCCLNSVQGLADEIVVVDGGSSDKSLEIAKSYGARVIITDNPPMFHINKQKALEAASDDWILQLDADEVVSPKLKEEIEKVIDMDDEQLITHQKNLKQKKLFLRNQNQLEKRDGLIGTREGGYAAFFIPRLNFFLGKYLKYGGTYPDGAIRLVKKGKAKFPCKDVHEIIQVSGKVGWLEGQLLHRDSPTLRRYLERNSRYVNLLTAQLAEEKVGLGLIQIVNYFFVKPTLWFLLTLIRYKGILDGYQGVIFSFFSALRFPRAYLRYIMKR